MQPQVRVHPHRRTTMRRRQQVTRFRGLSDEGEGKTFYLKGVDGKGNVASGTLYAHDKEDARSEFRGLYPDHEIVQVNERE